MVLVDTLDEQMLLERLLDEAKPAVPPAQRSLHWLLFTPFRYPPLPSGSRFRGPNDPGVFYGAEEQRTACAELGYWRWRLLMDSPALKSIKPMQQTLFRTPVRGTAIDLRQPPLSGRRAQWTHTADYRPCQDLASQARQEHIQIIRYESVRDPQAGACAALLSHTAFAASEPSESQMFMLAVFRHGVFWRLDSIFEERAFVFDTSRWSS
ncbi:RES domain-containing protein [Noviherbaspirillum cavernae]|uniref:RES domain-containing protein n=2 Tax=Noviherbaspirillum cavernae TaxID=2320862 RepID=A0A418X6M9_9BURK|nr:RES domain-containing protein [Noviherbaspirillum cavernae]